MTGRGRFNSRHAGYGLAIHHWVCRNCRKSWEANKPGYCDKCEQREFWHLDSRAEFMRFRELELMERAKVISNLQVHTRFDLTMLDKFAKPFHAAYYEADFDYTDDRGNYIVEDVKPKNPKAQSDLFKTKKKWVEKTYHLQITIIGR